MGSPVGGFGPSSACSHEIMLAVGIDDPYVVLRPVGSAGRPARRTPVHFYADLLGAVMYVTAPFQPRAVAPKHQDCSQIRQLLTALLYRVPLQTDCSCTPCERRIPRG
jgi:hypothetical protein